MKEEKTRFSTVVVKSAIKHYLKTRGMEIEPEAYDVINKRIGEMIDRAMWRCKQNKREVLEAIDLG